MKTQIKQDKGVAGLTILLSLIVMLFIIGLLVMIFSIMGSKLATSTYTTTTASSNNESLAKPTTAGITLTAGSSARDGVCNAIVEIRNGTAGVGDVVISAGNYTQTGCSVVNTTSWASYTSNVRYSYSYIYKADNTGTTVINDTTKSIAGVTDWFSIFIMIGAMVVLILLVVIIITAIKQSGMVSDGHQGANTVGTA